MASETKISKHLTKFVYADNVLSQQQILKETILIFIYNSLHSICGAETFYFFFSIKSTHKTVQTQEKKNRTAELILGAKFIHKTFQTYDKQDQYFFSKEY